MRTTSLYQREGRVSHPTDSSTRDNISYRNLLGNRNFSLSRSIISFHFVILTSLIRRTSRPWFYSVVATYKHSLQKTLNINRGYLFWIIDVLRSLMLCWLSIAYLLDTFQCSDVRHGTQAGTTNVALLLNERPSPKLSPKCTKHMSMWTRHYDPAWIQGKDETSEHSGGVIP